MEYYTLMTVTKGDILYGVYSTNQLDGLYNTTLRNLLGMLNADSLSVVLAGTNCLKKKDCQTCIYIHCCSSNIGVTCYWNIAHCNIGVTCYWNIAHCNIGVTCY